MSEPSRIVVFGATGYTGELVAEELVRQGHRPVLLARSRDRLSRLAASRGGLEHHVADVSETGSIAAALRAGDVLVSTVGPFVRWGDAAVEAAISVGAHYLDSTGEPAFIRRVFEHFGPLAAARGEGLVTACAFDWVPGNLAATLALTEAGDDATAVEVAYLTSGTGASGGTLASAYGSLLHPSHAHRRGRLVRERAAARAWSLTLDGRRRWLISVGGSEHFTVPKAFPRLTRVEVGMSMFGSISPLVPVGSALATAALRVPGLSGVVTNAIGRAASGSTGGPDAAARARGSSTVMARALSPRGDTLSVVRLGGVDGYTFTARFLAWAAIKAASVGLGKVGALGPVEAFGGVESLAEGVSVSGLHRR